MSENINVKENAVVVIVYDMLAKGYTAPMTFSNVACVKRYFKAKLVSNIEDYIIYKVAEYDELKGDLIICEREILFKGVELSE